MRWPAIFQYQIMVRIDNPPKKLRLPACLRASSLLLLLLSSLSSCSSSNPTVGVLPSPTATAKPGSESDYDPDALINAGLTPLLTPDDVMNSAGKGRVDPFAPPETYQLPLPKIRIPGLDELDRISALPIPVQPTKESILEEISGLYLVGVSTGQRGKSVAYVNYEQDDGAVVVGSTGNDDGLKPSPFLPIGWTVKHINVSDGYMIISKDKSRAILYVGEMPSAKNVSTVYPTQLATQQAMSQQQSQAGIPGVTQQPSPQMSLRDRQFQQIKQLRQLSSGVVQ